MLIPNGNFCLFEDWIMLTLDTMLAEQEEKVWFNKRELNIFTHFKKISI